jgi:serine/threonine protein kinase/predicted ATPase
MKPTDDAFTGTDRFSILRRLGAGGMGVVYEAYDRDRRERVALKTLREFDPAALYRFKQEFRALTETIHPNLVPLYELFGEGHQWFFTMELLENPSTLLAHVRPGSRTGSDASDSAETSTGVDTPHSGSAPPCPDVHGGESRAARPAPGALPTGAADVERIGKAFRQVAEAVTALHAGGKLHRDLKPSNVLVTGDGRVVVLDFGLVAQLGNQPGLGEPIGPSPETVGPGTSSPGRVYHSTDRTLAGTFGYMSPEQAARAPLTPASDWYAVGVMLFEALTGRMPFEGTPSEVLRAKQEEDAPAPSQLATGIPPDLDLLVQALLARDPARRPGGTEVLAALGGATTDADATGAAAPDVFVGRAAHLAELNAALDAMRQEHTVVCHISGRSGSGKTTLADRFLAGIDGPAVVVLRGHCYEQESVPYKAIDSLVDALTQYLLGLPPEELEQLAPPDMADLARIFPVLTRIGQVAKAARTSEALDLRELRRRGFAALRALLVALGRRTPLIVRIDDLQWGDVDSAELLSDLLRPPDAPRLLLLLAYRSEYADTSPCLTALRAAAQGEQPTHREHRIDVDALPEPEARALAAALLEPDRSSLAVDAAWIARESGGRPFFIYELAGQLRSGASIGAIQDLDAIIWQRVTRLPDVARRLLEVVAVAGRPLQILDAQAAASLPTLPSQIINQLRAGRLVRTTGPLLTDEIETFHDRIRESITAHLPPDTVRRYHANLAATLEQSGHADAETLAAHFEGAGEAERALHHYERAAAGAVQVLAFERAEALFRRAAALAGGDADRARIHERLIHFYTDMARFSDAYAVGREAVRPFGVRLPARFVPPLFLVDFIAARARLRGRTTRELLDLPPANDERLEAAVRLMNAVAKAAYQVKPELCVAVATKIVNLCLRHGNTPDCAIGYMVFGAIFHGGVLGNHRFGYDFGRLALDLVDRYRNEQQKAEVHFVVGYFGTSWLRPATEAEALWRVAFEAGLGSGDLFHTGCACAGTSMSYFMRGVPLSTVWGETDRFLEVLRRHRLHEPMGVVLTVRQAIRSLRGETASAGSLDDSTFDEAAFVRELGTYGSRHFAHFYFVAKTQLLYLAGEYEAALAMATQSASYLKDSPGMLHAAEHHFFHALVLLALGRSRRTAARTASRFRKWAAGCPDNFEHRALVLEGELARAANRFEDAANLLARAEESAATYGHIHVQGLAASLASRALAAAGRTDDAARARARAGEAFERWGATALAERVVLA